MSKKNSYKTVNTLLSIIIPVHRRFDLLGRCLHSIPEAVGNLSYQVILVDNNSPEDERKAFLSQTSLPPHSRMLYLTENQGYPKACNYGAKNASGALLFFLNSDVILEPRSVEQLVMNMDDPGVGVAGMKLLFPSEDAMRDAKIQFTDSIRPPEKVQHVGLTTNLRGQVIHMYLGWSADNPRVNAVYEVFAVTGAALLTRRLLFFELNGFDPAYGMGTFEDVDFCMKVREKGMKVVVDTLAVATHYTGATSEGYGIGYPLSQNEVIFKQKWYNKLTWEEWKFW